MAALHFSKRVHLLDELRGLIVLLMVFYHGVYDWIFLFGHRLDFFYTTGMEWLRLFIACQFMVISGIMCRYSRSNLKRGILCFGAALLLTAGTYLVVPSQRILFGILHLLGMCMLLFPLLQPLLDKLHPLLGMVLSLALFCFTSPIRYGYLGFGALLHLPLPQSLYDAGWLFPLGIHSRFFFSADYYPLLPWGFLFLLGTYFGVYFKKGLAPGWVYRPHVPALSAVGRHAMLIYLLHQPITYAVLYLADALLK